MATKEGGKFKDRLTGQPFKVRRIEGETVILEAEYTPNKFWIGDSILELFFERD